MSKPIRMWINQPSTLQPLHKLHGTNVLAIDCNYNDRLKEIYFLQGDTISMLAPKLSLSLGWVRRSK